MTEEKIVKTTILHQQAEFWVMAFYNFVIWGKHVKVAGKKQNKKQNRWPEKGASHVISLHPEVFRSQHSDFTCLSPIFLDMNWTWTFCATAPLSSIFGFAYLLFHTKQTWLFELCLNVEVTSPATCSRNVIKGRTLSWPTVILTGVRTLSTKSFSFRSYSETTSLFINQLQLHLHWPAFTFRLRSTSYFHRGT